MTSLLLRGITKSILALHLPTSITTADMKSIFKTAKELNLCKRVGETLCYISYADPESAMEAYDSHNDTNIGSTKVCLSSRLN